MVTVAKSSMTGLIAALEGEEPETNILRVFLRNRANYSEADRGRNCGGLTNGRVGFGWFKSRLLAPNPSPIPTASSRPIQNFSRSLSATRLAIHAGASSGIGKTELTLISPST